MSKYSGARRAVFAGAIVLLAAGLNGCTTIEGTNALTDIGTFEREVGQETLKGLGIIDRQTKAPITTPRAPLVLPKDNAPLPVPTKDNEVALLPKNSDKVQVDIAGLSENDIRRLRDARVYDTRAVSGRPLTQAEIAKLTERMRAANIQATPSTKTPLYLPPDKYFTTIGGKDLTCLTPSGDLVPLTDKACPAEIRNKLQKG